MTRRRKQEDAPTNQQTIDKKNTKKERLAKKNHRNAKMPQKPRRRKDPCKFKTMLNNSPKSQIIDAIT